MPIDWRAGLRPVDSRRRSARTTPWHHSHTPGPGQRRTPEIPL